MATPQDLVGVWSLSQNEYFQFNDDYTVNALFINPEDPSEAQLINDVYFYEPGYNIVAYLDNDRLLNVYQITNLNYDSFTWCLVEIIEMEEINRDSIGEIIGQIINQAQEGFELDPELYQSFRRFPETTFREMLESFGLIRPR